MIEYYDYRLKTQKNDIGILLPDERQLLRKLALRVKEIAMRPSQSVKIDLWRKHNKLEKVRPMVLAFPEGAWRELIPYETLTIINPFWRSYEYYLKRLIYRGERIHDDNVIEPIIEVPLVYSFSGWGMGVHTVFSKEEIGAVRWEPAIKELKDVEKLKAPIIKIDEDITKRNVNAVAEILGDLLPAQENRFISIDTRLIGAISRMRGIDQLMLDMVDEPEWLHEVMSFMLQSTLKLIDHVEKVGNISSNDGNDYVGTGGVGYSDELRQKDAGDGKTSFKNCWGVSESQDYEMISPIMYDEFAVKYQIPMLEHYGLNCYGCCESLNKKFEIVKKIPRLRRVSVSPWTNSATAAEALEDKYILSWKPDPVKLVGTYDREQLRTETERMLEVTKGCVVEMILKDTHTIEHDPERIEEWVDIAGELASSGYNL